MFIQTLFRDPLAFFTMAAIVCFSVCCHEFMHAYTALRCGDDTAARCGHLTLNPLRQMGVISLIMLAFIGICWGQVPVDRNRLRSRACGTLVALAGPLTNLALAMIFAVLTYFALRADQSLPARFLAYGSVINFILTMINLLPVPGLDGWEALNYFSRNGTKLNSEFSKGLVLFLMLAAFAGIKYIYALAEIMLMAVIKLIHLGVNWVNL